MAAWHRAGFGYVCASNKVLFVVVCLAALAMFSSNAAPARGETIVCGASTLVADARVYGLAPNTNYGGTTTIAAGAESGGAWRSYLRFDISQCLSVGQVIASAVLTMTPVQANNPVAYQLNIGAITGGWSENAVTWNSQPATGPVVATAICSDVNQEISFDVTALVGQWWANPASNLGLYLRAQNESGETAYFFASRENANFPERRPTLHITLATNSDACWSSGFSAGGMGANDWVNTFSEYQGNLYVGGRFSNVGGISCDGVAFWNGVSWYPVGTGMYNTYDLEVFAGQLWGAGQAVIRRWTGSVWESVAPPGAIHCYELATFDGALIACAVDGAGLGHVWRWSGTQWQQLGQHFNGKVFAAADLNGTLVCGGEFGTVGSVAAFHVAQWNGTDWVAIGSGANGTVNALTVSDGTLIAVGEFTSIDGVAANRIAAGTWSGTDWTWSPLAGGANAAVADAVDLNGVLVATGDFTIAGGVVCNHVATWDGQSWSGLGSGLNNHANAAALYQGALYVGGQFGEAGLRPSAFVGRWDCAIAPCFLSLQHPNGGEALCEGAATTITWDATGSCAGMVRIALERNGVECAVLSPGTPNDGSFDWFASACGGSTDGYALVVSEVGGATLDESDGTFSIHPACSVTLLEPNGGEIFSHGDEVGIYWQSAMCCGDSVTLELLLDGIPCYTIAPATANDGVFSWIADDCGEPGDYSIRVTDLGSSVNDASDGAFQILTSLRITKIEDAPNDQGRQVRIYWHRSEHDGPGGESITQYAVYRGIDPLALRSRAGESGDHAGDEIQDALALNGYDYVGSCPANGDDAYSLVVPSLCDSTISNGPCWTRLLVRALTPDPLVYFESLPDSGYSVDNLSPEAPQGLRWIDTERLDWDESRDRDFDYFKVYGSRDPGFDPLDDALLAFSVVPSYDPADTLFDYYHVAAVDFSGNEGAVATSQRPSGAGGDSLVPERFALHELIPNPSSSSVAIRYDVPRVADVEVGIYDVSGRLIRALDRGGITTAGRHAISWDGQNERGEQVPGGVYFCRLSTEGVEINRRLLRIK